MTYFTGKAVEKITNSTGREGIVVRFGDLGVSGTLEIYCRNVAAVTSNGATLRPGADYNYDEKAKKLTVPFAGATSVIVSGATGLFGK